MKRWVLASPVDGKPEASNFALLESAPRPLEAGEILVNLAYHTVAPGIRSKIGRETYAAMIRPGDTIPGMGVGAVAVSRHSAFAPGDIAWGEMAWATEAIVSGDKVEKLDGQVFGSIPLHSALGILGPSGLAAYFGLLRVAEIRRGEVVLISSAAGAVGAAAGQIARIHGCRVMGITGSAEKRRELIETFGFDDAIDYRGEADLAEAIHRTCPDGADVYLDNVGGPITDAALRCMKTFGRVAVCGQTSEYNATEPCGWRETVLIASRRLKIQGYIVFDFRADFPGALRDIAGWIRSGDLVSSPTIIDGVEHAAEAFVSLFRIDAPGRVLIRTNPSAP